jgi:hypothetical protein
MAFSVCHLLNVMSVSGGWGKSPLIYPNLSLPEIYISTTWDHKAKFESFNLMLIGVVEESAGGGYWEVCDLERTFVILVVRLVRIDSVWGLSVFSSHKVGWAEVLGTRRSDTMLILEVCSFILFSILLNLHNRVPSGFIQRRILVFVFNTISIAEIKVSLNIWDFLYVTVSYSFYNFSTLTAHTNI